MEVPKEVTQLLEKVIRKELFKIGTFVVGDELTIRYTFISHDSGNQFARWFWGGIGNAGEASIVVNVNYFDKEGNSLAKTQVEGRIDSGFFGGSIDEAITKAGEDIAEFTIKQFGQ